MSVRLLSHLVPTIAIDAGTQRTRIWSNLLEEPIDEATCLAIDMKSGRVVQIGDEAQAMEGRVGDEIAVVHPIRRGEITDADQFRAFLQMLLQKVLSPFALSRPTMMIAVPSSLSVAKREKLVDLLHSLGANEAYTINQSVASAIGSGIPIADATGSFVMHCGAGIVEASVISLGSSVATDSTWYAGHWMDEYIQTHLLHAHSLIVSMQTAQVIKHTMVEFPATDQQHLISGQDVSTASPREITIQSSDLEVPMQLFIRQYELVLKRLLAFLPPELSVDVIDKGILLSGGLAELRGLDAVLRLSLGVPVSVVENPSTSVLSGLKTALHHIDDFKQSLGYRN